jgi:hypothetical protein
MTADRRWICCKSLTRLVDWSQERAVPEADDRFLLVMDSNPTLRFDRVRIDRTPAPTANRPRRPGSFLLWQLLPIGAPPQEPAWRNGRR